MSEWDRQEGLTTRGADSSGAVVLEDAWRNSRRDPGNENDATPVRVPKELLAGMRSTRKLRERYARKSHQLAARCLAFWAALLCLHGALKITLGVEMWSDQVLIAITTGVTVSVLAAFLGVIRGLFPGKGKDGEMGEAKA